MTTILVATELPSGPDRAIERGIILGERLGRDVFVIHAIDAPIDDPRWIEAERAFESRLADLNPPAHLRLTYRIVAGPEAEAITGEARYRDATIIVLGPHRPALLRDLFGRATVARVMAETSRSVLVAADRAPRAYHRILMGIDFSRHAGRALEEAAALFPDADLRLVHAFDVPFRGFLTGEDTREDVAFQESERLDRFLSERQAALAGTGIRLRDRCALRQGETVSAISREVHAIDADLLVIGTHGQGGLLSLPFGSVARSLLENPPCDLLAVQSR